MTTKFISYYRVSTDRQGQSGLGLEAQQAAVSAYLKGKGSPVEEYTEIESGRKNDRPQLIAALAACRKLAAANRKDKVVLVIAKLDRLARNVHFISGLLESGVEFVAVDMPQANKLTIHILAAVAEHEREMISIRTKDALKAAKRRGVKLGNPQPQKAAKLAAKARRERAVSFARSVTPHIERLHSQGHSLRSIARWLNAHAIKTRRGCDWQPSTVRRVLEKV